MAPRHEHFSEGALLILQTAYAACDAERRAPSEIFQTLGIGHDVEEAAVAELQEAGLLAAGDYEGLIDPTDLGWSVIDKLWPRGQLGATADWRPQLVIGSFDGNDDLPTRLACRILLPRSAFRSGSRFARECGDQLLAFSAWRLIYPPTVGLEDRVLVRIDEGHGEVTEILGGDPDDDVADSLGEAGDNEPRMAVGVGTWCSIDRHGRCRESRQSLEELLFLIAMGAA